LYRLVAGGFHMYLLYVFMLSSGCSLQNEIKSRRNVVVQKNVCCGDVFEEEEEPASLVGSKINFREDVSCNSLEHCPVEIAS
jgi:hypothetical protein